MQPVRQCKFLASEQGCRFGDRCAFSHHNLHNTVTEDHNNNNDDDDVVGDVCDVEVDFVVDRSASGIPSVPGTDAVPPTSTVLSGNKRTHIHTSTSTTTNSTVDTSQIVCVFFQQGYCRKGLHCRFQHFLTADTDTDAVAAMVVSASSSTTATDAVVESTSGEREKDTTSQSDYSDNKHDVAKNILLKYSTSKRVRRTNSKEETSHVVAAVNTTSFSATSVLLEEEVS